SNINIIYEFLMMSLIYSCLVSIFSTPFLFFNTFGIHYNTRSDKAANIYQSSSLCGSLIQQLVYQHTPFNKQDLLPFIQKRSRMIKGLGDNR
ncbi:MAG: hypothetical protein L0H55_10685, partial [Candidatus Nitrosocosmicus sp.]|nr:hypothetical protein [Candidatus Nitrosocosmicus sp.]